MRGLTMLSRSLPASRLAPSSDPLPCTIIMIITDKRPAASSKTGAGAESEDPQDLAGPAKAVS